MGSVLIQDLTPFSLYVGFFMPTIEYRHNFPLEAAEWLRFLIPPAFRRPTNDLARIERMFANANLILSAWHEGKRGCVAH